MGAGVRADYGGGEILIVGEWVYRVAPGSTVVVTAGGVTANGVALPASAERATAATRVDRAPGTPLLSMTAVGDGSVAGYGNVVVQGGTEEMRAALEAFIRGRNS